MHKILPILLIPVIIFLIAVVAILPIKRFVVYKLGISGDKSISCCDPKLVEKSNGNFDELANIAVFNNQVIGYPKTSLAQDFSHQFDTSAVLGTTNTAGEEKWIEVSLDQQRLRAWEGNKIVMEFPISSGLWFSTPKGTFNIWYKTRSQTMKGGSRDLGTYYNLPNVPNNMFFYRGYALHGAYWHNNFGHPMSHGCVNEPLANAAQIFDWAGPVVPPGVNAIRATAENPGTKVYIH